MNFQKLKNLADAAESEDEIAEAQKAVLGSEDLISEDEQHELLTLLNAKQDALEEEEQRKYDQFRADAEKQFYISQTGRY